MECDSDGQESEAIDSSHFEARLKIFAVSLQPPKYSRPGSIFFISPESYKGGSKEWRVRWMDKVNCASAGEGYNSSTVVSYNSIPVLNFNDLDGTMSFWRENLLAAQLLGIRDGPQGRLKSIRRQSLSRSLRWEMNRIKFGEKAFG